MDVLSRDLEKLRQHIEQIVSLNDEQFEYVQSFFAVKRVRKGQFLVHEGDEVRHEFLVLSGIYRVFYLDADGKEHILQFAKENWWMSDYYGFFKQMQSKMFIECMEEGEVLYSTLHARETLAKEIREMEHFYRVKLTNGYVALQQRIMQLLTGTPQQRYEDFLAMYPDLMQSIPKKYIAQYLGVSRETLSRLYSQ